MKAVVSVTFGQSPIYSLEKKIKYRDSDELKKKIEKWHQSEEVQNFLKIHCEEIV